MDRNLFLKEQEYYEINKKLEKRARELLEKVDDMKTYHHKEDITATPLGCSVSDTRINLKPNIKDLRSKSGSAINVAQGRNYLTHEELKDLNLPEDVNNVGDKGFKHFLKSKVKQLQFDLDKLNHEHKSKSEEFRKVQKDNTKLQEDKEKFLQQGNIARNQIVKLENQVTIIQSKLQTKENENMSLIKDIDGLNRELKLVKSQSKGNEVRFQHALDELSKLKESLRSMQQDSKEVKEAHRKHSNAMNDTIKRLEKQKNELLNGFKKQFVLVDNLKRQKVQLEAVKLNEKVEADFIKMMTK